MKLFEFIDLNISHVHAQKKKKKSEKRVVQKHSFFDEAILLAPCLLLAWLVPACLDASCTTYCWVTCGGLFCPGTRRLLHRGPPLVMYHLDTQRGITTLGRTSRRCERAVMIEGLS